MENIYFNPGCAWTIYKPDVEEKTLNVLRSLFPNVSMHRVCCHHNPKVEPGSRIICICSGCHRRFNKLYEGVRGVTLWETLNDHPGFQLPDYGGREMSVHDACPARKRPEIHAAVRSLLEKMNIRVKEARLSGYKSVCCGNSFYDVLPIETTYEHMRRRAASMPCDNVVVYCVTCLRSMRTGGRRPHHLLDLLFGDADENKAFFEMPIDEYYRRVGEMRSAD
jgi:hypothetical protein